MEAQRKATSVRFVHAASALGAKNAMVKKTASNGKRDKRFMTTSGQYLKWSVDYNRTKVISFRVF
jgi:hypothetical protein